MPPSKFREKQVSPSASMTNEFDMGGEDLNTIQDAFANSQNKSDISEILKELFNEDKINLITDLKSDEIKLITRIKTIASIKGWTQWDSAIELFLKLKISKDRSSRKEIIEAIKGYYGGGMGGGRRGMFGMFGGRGNER